MEAPAVALRSDEDFAAVVVLRHPQLLRTAILLCGNRAVAEDAVAEALARTYPAWRRGRVQNLDAYLTRAVVNQLRGGQRRAAHETRHAERRTAETRGQADPGEVAVQREAMMHALRRVPIRQRTVVVLRFYCDHTEQDIADLLGIRPGTVKSQLARGLDNLRQQLGKERHDA